MTELEKQLFDHIKEEYLDLIKRVVCTESDMKEVHFPVMINGSIDTIIKYVKTGDIKLKYNYAKKGIEFAGTTMSDSKDIEQKFIDLNPLKKLI